jgi:16S rRNA (cytosine967-C5)-methyltransferase
LTYAVCTVTRAETTAVVSALLGAGGWTVDDLEREMPAFAHPDSGGFLLTLPWRHGTSGFFIARLRKADEARA